MRSLALLPALCSAALAAQSLPELPQVYLETCYPTTNSVLTVCSSGCDYSNGQLQQALNAVQPGTTLLLQGGHTYNGSFTLPAKTGEGWIVIRSNTPDNQLPQPDHRMDPSYAGVMANVRAPVNQSAFTFLSGAHHYYLMGLEFSTAGYVYDIIRAGDGSQTNVAQLPHDLVFDRLYVHGDAVLGTKRGIMLNSASTAVVNCHISDCKALGQDAQAVAGWNGPGPFKLVNNYLEGSGENVMFGGANPAIQDLVPSDIEVRNNHFFKPLSWQIGHPTYAGTAWCIKNLFELKNAQRILVEGNIFENNWAHCQSGFAIVLTPRTQGGVSMWARVTDVTWRYNILRNSDGGFNMSGHDDQLNNPVSTRILIEHNLAYDLSNVNKLYQFLNGLEHLTIRHNTNMNAGTTTSAGGAPMLYMTFADNICGYGSWGVCGTGAGCGNGTINTYFPGSTFTHNVLVGTLGGASGSPAQYPPNHWFPAQPAAVGFVDLANNDYALLPTSPYANAATDGTDLGADMDSLSAHTANVLPGIWPACAGISTQVASPRTSIAITVFPNPAAGIITVRVPRQAIGGSVSLINALGHVVRRIPVQAELSQLDLSGVAKQVYFLRITDAEGAIIGMDRVMMD